MKKCEIYVSEKTKRIILIIFTLIGFIVIGYFCFHQIGKATLMSSDEARHGVNAYEMIRNQNYIVTTYRGEIDYWNLKPPLSEYMILLGFKLFGYNLLGLRFYSALSMFILVAICFFYSYKNWGSIAAFAVLLGFAAVSPFWYLHCARYGDADSMFILFYTLGIICLTDAECTKKRYMTCLCFAVCFLLKSWHAGILAVAILFCFFYFRLYKNLKIKDYVLCVLFALGPILLWAGLRFSQDGMKFFQEMVQYDLLNRSINQIEGHEEKWYYYFKRMSEFPAIPAMVFLIPVSFAIKEKRKKIIVLLAGVVIPIALFSFASTKIGWYIIPAYPALILIFSASVSKWMSIKRVIIRDIFIVVIFILFLMPSLVLSFTYINEPIVEGTYTDTMFQFITRKPEYSSKILYGCFNAEFVFTAQTDRNVRWKRRGVLAAELTGDFIPIDGGIQEFCEEEDCYILIQDIFLEDVTCDYIEEGHMDDLYLLYHPVDQNGVNNGER